MTTAPRYAAAFRGRTALVTGGGSGIGAALTHALTAAGAEVWCTDVDADAAEKVAAAAGGPGTAHAVPLDVTNPHEVEEIVQQVLDQAHGLDLLFNNAGILYGGPTDELSLAQWNRIIDINLGGVVHGINAAYPHMIRAGRGQIVNVASLGGLVAGGLVTSYIATKHAVVGLSLALRSEAAQHGVGVTVVCPSAVATPILDQGGFGGFDGQDFFVKSQGLTSASTPEAIAADILAGVARDRAMVVTPRSARMTWRVNRLAPGLVQRLGVRHVGKQMAAMKSRVV